MMVLAITAGFLILAGLVVTSRVYGTQRRAAELQQRAAFENEARLRRWVVEERVEAAQTISEVRGETHGVRWRLQRRYSRSGGRRDAPPPNTLWSAASVGLPDAMLIVWPSFGPVDMNKLASAPKFLVDMMLTPLVNALGVDEKEAAMISSARAYSKPVARLAERYAVRTTDEAWLDRFLASGGSDALVTAGPWLVDSEADHHLVVGIVSRSGVRLQLSGFVADADLISKIAELGVAMVRAAG